jgi:hypothetical protein
MKMVILIAAMLATPAFAAAQPIPVHVFAKSTDDKGFVTPDSKLNQWAAEQVAKRLPKKLIRHDSSAQLTVEILSLTRTPTGPTSQREEIRAKLRFGDYELDLVGTDPAVRMGSGGDADQNLAYKIETWVKENLAKLK